MFAEILIIFQQTISNFWKPFFIKSVKKSYARDKERKIKSGHIFTLKEGLDECLAQWASTVSNKPKDLEFRDNIMKAKNITEPIEVMNK